ncbi:YbgA family protein [Staphylococcus kloosii]|uniref:YbgA family protein n=1 Tax=Staphylococcus kloosii TaxID=29384 RepID=UPI0028A469CC|nr:YbgA family protein [Staphylococcus kloosii]MDT3959870.1 YbgA family protein [Staphylococcus kloosii]
MKARGYIERLWRTEKYRVLVHSKQHYDEIRELIKQDPSYTTVKDKINEALKITPTTGSMINAYDHMWGYFKNKATPNEKEQYLTLKQQFQDNQIDASQIQQFLKNMADAYEVQYLIESTALYK